jgi:hypothetical protein
MVWTQVPLPLQALVVSVLPEQLGGAQTVWLLGKLQAAGLEPLQVPRQTPPPAQGVREPCGCPLVTVVQVPSEPDTSQAWHWPLH